MAPAEEGSATIDEALRSVAELLAADGYLLQVDGAPSEGQPLAVVIRAGPNACEECLVPKPVMSEIIGNALADRRLSREVRLVYPTDPPSTAG